MITTLAIKNYALIEDIHVEFHDGLTIITGETGAGKSILLGAMALLLGKRADLASVKDASKKCVIEGEFSIESYRLDAVFEENDLDYDRHTIIRREILPSGKSRAFINDSPVSLSQLQTLGTRLVDIHSQHETLSLTSENFQLEVIDAMAGTYPLIEAYTRQHEAFIEVTEKISELVSNRDSSLKELDYNSFLLKELEELTLEKIDQQELEETYETLNNTELIQESLSKINQLLSQESFGTIESSKEARASLSKLRDFSGSYNELWERFNSVIIELEDIYEGVENLAANIEADPAKLNEVNEKLQILYKLQQKHGVNTVSELLEIRNNLKDHVVGVENLDERINVLNEELSILKKKTLELGKELHQKRKEILPNLGEKLELYLGGLGLPNARFQFNLKAVDSFRKNGLDTLELLFTANKGLPFGPLKKVASGGEMSRIMLAIKAVLAEYKELPTVIFDEIDSGVSGEIANKMAGIMEGMSRNLQLLSITHLPQIAAKGTNHIKVYKEDVNEVTQTRLKSLTIDERIVEIAQMIGGSNVTDAAIANAKELLN